MGEKTVVTWLCDQCGKESESLQRGVTFNQQFDDPQEWRRFYPPAETVEKEIFVDGHRYHLVEKAGMFGVGAPDPRLVLKPFKTFCCEEHKLEWIEEHYPEYRHNITIVVNKSNVAENLDRMIDDMCSRGVL